MKKILLTLILGLIVFVALPVLAASKVPASKTIYFYQNDGSGPWGQMTYNVSGSTFNFSFTAIAPIANDWYALVVGKDPLNHPETAVILDYPRSGGDTGEINIAKSIELNRDLKKVQVWLVHAHDIATDGRYTRILYWTNWGPEHYLFGSSLIKYNDGDPDIR